ncbi:MAG: EamA family transporter [Oscillospiraceae bacterium]|nr:EamA family transporter [Oscillospiraceae bacterium]MBQ6902166.1 EamA family transporter [Oscillospiraceae bacterium]
MNRNYIYIILAAALWGTMGVFVNGLSAIGLTTVQIAMLRALVSLIFITCLILFKNRGLFKIRLRDLWMFFGTGIISYFLFNNCYFVAIKSVGVAVSSVLLYTSPIFVTLMSCILFREKMTGKKLFCLVLAVGGCALVSGLASGGVGKVSTGGVLIGLASGFTYALYSIFSTYALKKYEPLTVTFYTFLFGTVAALIIGKPAETFDIIASPSGILWAVSLGIISGAVPYFLYTVGLSKVNPSHAAVMATVEPVVASLIGIFVFNEASDLFTVLGIALIISAAAMLNMGKDRQK